MRSGSRFVRSGTPGRTAGLAIAIAIAVVVGGCGNDDDDATGSAAGDTEVKAAFVAQGEQLCSELKAQLDVLFVDFAATLSKRAEAYRQAVPLGRQFSERFAALTPPPGDEATIAATRRDYDEGLNQLEAGVEAAEAGDIARSNAAFAAGFEAFGRSDAALRAYGFTVCAEPKTTRGVFGLSDTERQAFAAEKRAYIERADAVCQANQARLDPLEERTFGGGKVPDLPQWRDFLTEAVPIFEDTVTKLRAIPLPEGDKATIDAMLAEFEKALAGARLGTELAAAGDQRGFDQVLDDLAASAQRGDAAARQYGFRHCKEG